MSEDEATPPPPPHHEAPAALPAGAGISTLGITLIGGAVAAALGGALLAIPFFRRKTSKSPSKKPAAKPRAAPQARRPRRSKPTE